MRKAKTVLNPFWNHAKSILTFAGRACPLVRRVTVIPKPTSLHSPEYKAFLRLLIETRQGAGLSQRALAKRLEKPQSYISKSETGERRVDVVEAIAFCRAIGISWADFAVKAEEVIYSLVPD